MPTIADNKITQLQQTLGDTRTNLDDLEWSFYSANSGLTPPNKYSISDHKLAYYKLEGAAGSTIREVEMSFWSLIGAQGNDYDSRAYDFYTNYGFGPGSISGLALWLDAASIGGTVIAQDTFDRSKNLWADKDPSFETDTSYLHVITGCTITQSAAQSRSGTNSALLTATGTGAFNADVYKPQVNGFAAVTPGQTYTFSCWVYSNARTSARLQLVWSSVAPVGSGPAFMAGNTNNTTIPLNSWTRVTVTGVAPAGALGVYLNIGTTLTGAANDLFYIDDIQVEVGSKATLFTWGDSSNLGVSNSGHAWLVQSGSGYITPQKTANMTVAPFIAAINVGISDVVLSAPIYRADAPSAPSVTFRHIDGNNFLMARINGNALQLYKCDAGVFTLLNSVAHTDLGLFTITVSAIGSQITISADDGVSFTYTLTGGDATKYTNTSLVGIRFGGTATAYIDNFTVKTPVYSDGAALPIWPDISGNYRHAVQATASKQPLFRNANPNLLTYADATFETGVGDWQPQNGNTSIVQFSATASHGTASLAIYSTSTSAAVAIPTIVGQPNGFIPVTPGRTYYASAVAKAASTTVRSCRVSISWWSSLTTWITNTSPGAVNNSNSGWTTFTASAAAPAGAVYATVQLEIAAAAGPRVIADGTLTSGSPTLVSATAAFTSGDVGRYVTGTGIPARTYIQSVQSGTSVTMSANATSAQAADSITISSDVHYFDDVAFYADSLPSAWVPPVTLPSTGKPAVQFDGAADILQTSVDSLPAPRTIFVIAKSENTGASYIVLGGSSGNEGYFAILSGGALRNRDGITNLDTGAGIASNAWNTYSLVQSGASSFTFQDGAQKIGGSTTDTTWTQVALGNNASGGFANSLLGSIVAILVFNRVLSTNERQRVERYLKARYGTP